MARTAGITQEQVNIAAAELVAAGKTPGVRNVREALGTGSNQTIQAMLQHWQKAQPLPAAADAEPVELPPELLQALQVALGNAKAATAAEYQEAIASAQAQRDRATQDALTQYSEYEQQLENAALQSREAMELRGKNGELQKQVDALRETDQQRQAAEKRSASAEATVSALQAELAKAQGAQKTAEDKAAGVALELSKAEGRISVLQERAALAETLQQRVFKLEAQLPPTEPEKTAQKA